MNSMTNELEQTLAEMVSRNVRVFQPEKVILFGSLSRGDAGPDSDVDLLVVTQVEGSRRQMAIEMRMALSDITVPKDIVILTQEEMDAFRNVVGHIAYTASREGKVLYERAA